MKKKSHGPKLATIQEIFATRKRIRDIHSYICETVSFTKCTGLTYTLSRVAMVALFMSYIALYLISVSTW